MEKLYLILEILKMIKWLCTDENNNGVPDVLELGNDESELPK